MRAKLEQTTAAIPPSREKYEALTAQLGSLMLNILLFQKGLSDLAESHVNSDAGVFLFLCVFCVILNS